MTDVRVFVDAGWVINPLVATGIKDTVWAHLLAWIELDERRLHAKFTFVLGASSRQTGTS